MIWVFMAALVGGIAVLLQAQSARAEDHSGHLGLLATLVRRPRYVAGLACMLGGFVAGALALRTLPLFAVQAGRSSSLAVTAVLAVLMIGARLKGRDMLAIVAVGAGLIAVAVSSRHGRAHLVLDGWALACRSLWWSCSCGAVRSSPGAGTRGSGPCSHSSPGLPS